MYEVQELDLTSTELIPYIKGMNEHGEIEIVLSDSSQIQMNESPTFVAAVEQGNESQGRRSRRRLTSSSTIEDIKDALQIVVRPKNFHYIEGEATKNIDFDWEPILTDDHTIKLQLNFADPSQLADGFDD